MCLSWGIRCEGLSDSQIGPEFPGDSVGSLLVPDRNVGCNNGILVRQGIAAYLSDSVFA